MLHLAKFILRFSNKVRSKRQIHLKNKHYILCYLEKYSCATFTNGSGWTIGVPGFDSRRGLGILLFTTVSRTAPGPTQCPIQWVPGALSLGVKRPWREADHSPPSTEVKE
jgi:hypothetical protein